MLPPGPVPPEIVAAIPYPGPMTSSARTLLVVGAGPAGRALAHRALVHGMSVTVVDPAPDAAWRSTFGMFDDDLPGWLPRDVIACDAPSFTVFTPERREVGRRYCVLDAPALQRALTLDGARLEASRAREITAHTVRLDDGRLLSADHVIDARGGGATDPRIPRQTAYGAVVSGDGTEMVLMDWRQTGAAAPTFSYRVGLGGGRRLIEETCLAGAPPVPLDVLAARNARRAGSAEPGGAEPELVDFPLHPGPAPWRSPHGGPRSGAAGGLMHPATGYSIAASLGAADGLAAALARGGDPVRALWPRRARWTYRLRLVGLAVLLGFDGRELTAFFDAFFGLPVHRQRAYLGGRDDLRGTLATMWAVFRALPGQQKARLVIHTGRAVWAGRSR